MPHQSTVAPETAPLVPAPDCDAFERLTVPYLADVARFARSLARDDALADDLVQETYLQALRGWHTFREGSDPKRWLLTVCHHAFMRMLRREARYVEAPDDDPTLQSVATARTHWHAQESGLMRVVERMDLGAAIQRAVAELPATFRSTVVLVDVEGYTYEEAAGIIGIALGTVRSRLFRARRLLQDALFEYARDEGFDVSRAARLSPRPSPADERPIPPNPAQDIT
jgi:RNA polymerase sigma-70 factor (ECF subfamily)